MNQSNVCNCGSGEEARWVNDARGIPVVKACDACRDEKIKGYRPEIFDNPNYEADENIEPEEY